MYLLSKEKHTCNKTSQRQPKPVGLLLFDYKYILTRFYLFFLLLVKKNRHVGVNFKANVFIYTLQRVPLRHCKIKLFLLTGTLPFTPLISAVNDPFKLYRISICSLLNLQHQCCQRRKAAKEKTIFPIRLFAKNKLGSQP